MRLLLTTIFTLYPLAAMAQTIEKIDDTKYTRTNVETVDIAEKQGECDAITAQYNSLQERMTECQAEVDTARQSDVGKPVIIDAVSEVNP